MLEEDLRRFDYFNDLLDVGISKHLGYLPINTIEKQLKNGVSILQDWANGKDLHSLVSHTGNVWTGALYIWDRGLEGFLKDNAHYLTPAGVPLTAKEYVLYINHHVVYSNQYPEAYIIVGKSFNDCRFRAEMDSNMIEEVMS